MQTPLMQTPLDADTLDADTLDADLLYPLDADPICMHTTLPGHVTCDARWEANLFTS